MMEFFLSKVWLFVCGLAVTAVLVLAFSGMDHSVASDEVQRRVSQLADTLDSVSYSPNGMNVTISMDDFLPDPGSVAKISTGYVCIGSGTERRYAPLHASMMLTDRTGSVVDNCTLVHGDLLVVHKDLAKRSLVHVQVAKERTVSFTA